MTQPAGQADLLVVHASELVTIAGKGGKPVTGKALEDLGILSDGAVAAKNGRIVAVGKTDEIVREYPPHFRNTGG